MPSRSETEFASVMTLMEIGHGDHVIARLTGVPRSTVAAWRRGQGIARHLRQATARPGWRPQSPAAYSYLLGAYLGDGHVAVHSRRSASLVITLDSSYPAIIAEVHEAVAAVFPGVAVHEHTRRILLSEWQRELTHDHTKALLRGLIHSDGCRTVNRFKTKLPSGRVAEYEYPRYFFSNLSADIRAIFCEHCDLLGIRWTQSNPRNISVSYRRSVALLDQFVGPKA